MIDGTNAYLWQVKRSSLLAEPHIFSRRCHWLCARAWLPYNVRAHSSFDKHHKSTRTISSSPRSAYIVHNEVFVV